LLEESKSEPQNIEHRMKKAEGELNFIIRNSLFDIRYSLSSLVEAGGFYRGALGEILTLH